ncbi:hypothetical protein TNCV_5104841 [Trichonephila clavipes]|nr:hypothetical protein TNCV_5104841 [Trichonephila clavipes]
MVFTKALAETNPHYHSHLNCHRLQRSMKRFTSTKLTDMRLIYELAEGNAQAARRLYLARYSQRDAPDRRIFINLHHNLYEYGSLRDNRHNEMRAT